MTKKLLILTICFVGIIFACTKKNNSLAECDEFYIQKMRDKWASGCFYEVLNKGSYKSKIVYYITSNCPMCNTVPPAYGLTCSGDTVKWGTDYQNVQHIKFLAFCNAPD